MLVVYGCDCLVFVCYVKLFGAAAGLLIAIDMVVQLDVFASGDFVLCWVIVTGSFVVVWVGALVLIARFVACYIL